MVSQIAKEITDAEKNNLDTDQSLPRKRDAKRAIPKRAPSMAVPE
jgi:hypothetical protein